MASKDALGKEGSHAQEAKQRSEAEAFEVIDEAAEREKNLHPTVEMETQAKVDTNHPDATVEGLTLAAEERMEARDGEIERTHERWDRRQDSDREARSRAVVNEQSVEKRREFAKRAASVDRWLDPDATDPREQLSREELAAVNEQTQRMAEKVEGWSRGAISRRLAERVVEGADIQSAVMEVHKELQRSPGGAIPIAEIGSVERREVTVEGTVAVLWEPAHASIAQVGLIEDDSGRIKFTVWKASEVGVVGEGEHVRFRAAAKNWYDGRVSIALTGRSQVEFPERGRWWA